MATLTQEIKKKATNSGFSLVGVTTPDRLFDLPYGWVWKVKDLKRPGDILPEVKAVIVMALRTWDQAFYTDIESPNWRGYGLHPPGEEFESYFFANMVTENRAWRVVEHLRTRGYKATITRDMPMKTAAVRCGLGWQGKNTLLITQTHGPRVSLVSVLTDAPLEADEPFTDELCGECERCLKACPTGALEPYRLNIVRCLTYSAESPHTTDVPPDVRELDGKLIKRPTAHSYIECTTCIDACPIGKPREGRA
jgi:epoxyqueuosine reductase QueG